MEDNGCGIAAEDLPRVFEPFFTTKPVGKGTGLGLSVVRRIVDAHHGEIGVVSQPGDGTAVTVRLPPADDSAAAPGPDDVPGGAP